jgi:hypothetical protein
MVAAATLLTGCTGAIEDAGRTGPKADGDTPGSGTENGSANGSGTNTGNGNGNATGGSGTNTGSANTGSASGSGTTTNPGGGTNNPGTMDGTSGTPNPTSCTPGVPGTTQLPRLTAVQYDNTVRDLVGFASSPPPSSMLAPDSPGSVDQRAWDGYQAAAQALAPQIMANASAKAKVVPCTPSGDGSACAQQMIQTFGQKAFRRPLTTDEVARFMKLYTDRANLTATGTFDEAAELILRAFLVSPSFITRAELSSTAQGAYYVLNGYEVASRLSYMLWGTMPDDALFAKAAANGLSTPEGILSEAKRLLADPKARNRVSAFHESYALMGPATRWSEISRDTSMFPTFNASLVPTLSEATKRFFDYVTFEGNGSFQDLLLKPVAFVNKALAPVYGLSGSFGADLVKADLDPAQRAGVFTQAGFLTAYSSFNRTSPILRGAFLQKQILCTTIGAPPPDALNTPVPTDPNLVTNRQKVDAQTSAASCVGCHHSIVNPTGFAMEAYDGVGVWQTKEKASGAAVDTGADVLIGSSIVHVNGPLDLMQKIAASSEAQRCYAQRWVEFAYERNLTTQDVCTVQTMAQKMTQGGYTVQNLIVDLTQSDSFRYRTEVAP